MRYLIISLLVLLISIFLGLEISQVNNYVLIAYNHWIIESSLWVTLLLLFLFFVLLYTAIRLISRSANIAKHYREWRASHRQHKARELTQRGLCELAEGEWVTAEKTLLKAARFSKSPLIDYLSAARAAQAQQAFDRRDDYLRFAHSADKEAAIAIGLTQAQLQMDGKQWEQALATLQHLYQRAPTHSHILKLLAEVYIKLHEWKKCANLFPALKKHHSIPLKEFQPLESKVYFSLLESAYTKDISVLTAFWKTLPTTYKNDLAFITHYAQTLLEKQQDETVIKLIENHLKKEWHPSLLKLYSQAHANNPSAQLHSAEHWYKKHPYDAALLLCLGQLCIRNKLWGKAKDYLQQSIDSKPGIDAYIELGTIHDHLNESEKSQQCFRAALQLIR